MRICSLLSVLMSVAITTSVSAEPTPQRTVKSTPEAVALGEKAYEACVDCHGQTGGGTTGKGPRINSEAFLAATSDETFLLMIRKGRPGTTMEGYGEKLTDAQLDGLVAFIRAKHPTKPITLNESPCTGDSKRGKALFAERCADCHGQDGAGYQEWGTAIGRRGFLRQVSDGYLRHIILHGKDATSMRGFERTQQTVFARLSPAEVEDVVAYLRAHAW